MSRTPEQDAEVIDMLLEIRRLVMGRHEVYEGVFPSGEKYRSVLYETNPSIAAIDYAIGVMKATQQNWQDDPQAFVFTKDDGDALRAMAWAKGTVPDFMSLAITADNGCPWFTLTVPAGDESVVVCWPERQKDAIHLMAAARTCATRNDWLKYIADRGVEWCIAKAWQDSRVRKTVTDNGATIPEIAP